MDAFSGPSTADANRTIWGLDTTGFTGTFTHNTPVTLTINGSDSASPNPGTCSCTVKIVAGMTYTKGGTAASAISFVHSTGGVTSTVINANSTPFGAFVVNLSDAANTAKVATSGSVSVDPAATSTVTDGVFDISSGNFSTGFFNSSNSATRTITCGSSTLTVTGVGGTVYTTATTTNLTQTCSSGTINFAGTTTSTKIAIMAASGVTTYSAVNVTNPTSNAFQFVFATTSFTAANMTLTNLRTLAIQAITITVSSTFAWSGPASTTPGLLTSNGNVSSNLNVANAVTTDWLALSGITRTGAGTFTSNNCLDSGFPASNGFTCLVPSGSGGGGRIIGG